MNIEFDPVKDAANVAKHGVSLALAGKVEWSDVLCVPDNRCDYGEVREIGFTMIEQRLYVVVFVQRSAVMRIPGDVQHNSLRPVAARARATRCVAFLANSPLLAAKRRLAAHPDPHSHILARFMLDIPCLRKANSREVKLYDETI